MEQLFTNTTTIMWKNWLKSNIPVNFNPFKANIVVSREEVVDSFVDDRETYVIIEGLKNPDGLWYLINHNQIKLVN